MRSRAFLLLALASSLSASSESAEPRSRALRAEFQRLAPCPATGATRGPCLGWERDHLIALCLTGPGGDILSNYQWLTVEDHKKKTRRDLELCRQAKRL